MPDQYKKIATVRTTQDCSDRDERSTLDNSKDRGTEGKLSREATSFVSRNRWSIPREGSNTIEEYEMVTQVNGLDAISKQMQVLNAVS